MNKSWEIAIGILGAAVVCAIFLIWQHGLLSNILFASKTTTIQKIDQTENSLQDYYQESQTLQTQTATSSTASFLAVGDINLSRNVAAFIVKNQTTDYPFAGITDLLKSTNFNFANLESPIAPGLPIIGGTSMTFAAPSGNAQALQNYNFEILNLANNHAYDQGLAGINKTKTVLDNLGIAHEGTGNNLNEAWIPAVVTANGIKICFVGAAYGTNTGGSVAAQYIAEIADTAHLQKAIATAKQECDFTVATMHAGIEYTRTPNQAQMDFAHTAIDDGADIVIGAHPHWVQTIEKYNGKYIFYSLGNFIFDQDWSQETQEGLTLKIMLSKPVSSSLQGPRQPAALDSIELIPIIIDSSQPRPATSDETKTILQKINQVATVLYP